MSVKSGSGLRYQPHSMLDGEVDYQRTSQTGPDIGKCLDEKLQYALNLLPSRADYDTMQPNLVTIYTRLWKINRPALLTGAIMDPYSKLQRLNWLLYLPAKGKISTATHERVYQTRRVGKEGGFLRHCRKLRSKRTAKKAPTQSTCRTVFPN
ncbi:Protein of unknown function [Pyronema omphalodes CBS 100304]|uniref:Uncharacterized protein n=1 Tax=Pyronema omphalodes (strain CBS 100304) TaxID=1076935 RepID=U4LIP9_PYROM|nr:Protein of unknown function [Pyronema omphalodes CBS 100304]